MLIYIYLYCFQGEPVYVGQTCNLEQRDRRHSRRIDSPFDAVLQFFGRENFSLEIIGQVEDVPHGEKANDLENEMMDRFGTYRINTGKGYNIARARGPRDFTEEDWKARQDILRAVMSTEPVRQKLRDSWAKPGEKERRTEILIKSFNTLEAKENRSRAQKGRLKTQKERDKISASLKGNVPWNKGRRQRATCGEANPSKRPEIREKLQQPKSLETRQRMSDFQKGRPKSESHREAMKKAHESPERKKSVLMTNHNRWHAARGVKNSQCEFCKGDSHGIHSSH